MRQTDAIYIDVGSLTIKVYKKSDEKLIHLVNQSLPFKEGYTPETGISLENKTKLFDLINNIKEKHTDLPIRIFATAVFRKMTGEAQVRFIDEFFLATGLYFNIVPHDLENYYLEMALVEKCHLDEPVLLINIGGGSTELVVMYGLDAIERHNIDLGVSTINTNHPTINNEKSGVALETVVEEVKKLLPSLDNTVRKAFYSGGELTYMQLAKYDLTKNVLFDDEDHPSLIATENLATRNEAVFAQVAMHELEALMPENPTWMHGARGCSAIAQAICETYGITTIIPSNADLIHGAARQALRTVVISGSFRKHLKEITVLKKQLADANITIVSPRFTEPKNPGEEFVVFTGEEGLEPLELERYHLTAISQADALVVCDPGGYVGASALIELGYANALGKKVIFTEKPEEFMLNTLPAEIGIY